MLLNKTISKNYCFNLNIANSGLAAIFVSARCKSKKQTGLNIDENLRIQINGLNFRETPPQKNIQFFNIPPSFNGSRLKGDRQTIVLFTCLSKGEHYLNLIPKPSAFIEEIKIQELTGQQNIEFNIEDKAENGNSVPWFTFVLIDLPLSNISANFTIEKRLWDSDDVKIIAGFDLANQPEILGTLYNIENINKPIEPHTKPSPNSFGTGVKDNYEKVKKLLGL